MNDSNFQDLLELEVSNFGPIVEAKIDLRPLDGVRRTEQHGQVLSWRS